ncbi:HD domain-containing protein [Pedobacter sp.]|nr:HD domain-containing protein [Candidatus Saccharibacteria bacterium]
MNESLFTPTTNTRFEIDEAEAERRLIELEPIAKLAHLYSRVQRATRMSDGSFETDGDHVVQLQIIALAYVSKYHPEIDAGKLTIYLLLHDLVEAIVGDTCTLGADEAVLSAKDDREAAGMIELEAIFRDFPELIGYLHDYESIRNPEAAFGKGFDKLTPGYLHVDDEGATLRELGVESYEQILEAASASDARLEVYADAFQDVITMRKMQHRRVARIAFGAMADESATIS